jgi:hypothetical protein
VIAAAIAAASVAPRAPGREAVAQFRRSLFLRLL